MAVSAAHPGHGEVNRADLAACDAGVAGVFGHAESALHPSGLGSADVAGYAVNFGSSKPSMTILSLGPSSRNFVLTAPVVPRSGRAMIHALSRTTTSTRTVPRISPSLLKMS
jgi:hypothetical protein